MTKYTTGLDVQYHTQTASRQAARVDQQHQTVPAETDPPADTPIFILAASATHLLSEPRLHSMPPITDHAQTRLYQRLISSPASIDWSNIAIDDIEQYARQLWAIGLQLTEHPDYYGTAFHYHPPSHLLLISDNELLKTVVIGSETPFKDRAQFNQCHNCEYHIPADAHTCRWCGQRREPPQQHRVT